MQDTRIVLKRGCGELQTCPQLSTRRVKTNFTMRMRYPVNRRAKGELMEKKTL